MNTRFYLIIFFSFNLLSLNAQNGFFGKETTVKKICQHFHAHSFGESKISVFQSRQKYNALETDKIISRILYSVDNPINFVTSSCENVPNCVAGQDEYLLYLFYNPSFLKSLENLGFGNSKVTDKNWELIAVLAHEIGHLLLEHWINSNHSIPKLELEADEFAGKILARLGSTLEQAQSIMHSKNVSEQGSYTHPARKERLRAIEKGWNSVSQKENWLWYQKGIDHFLINENQEAIRWFEKAAKYGLACANNMIGELLFSGKGIVGRPKHVTAALPYWKKAAKDNNTDALLSLAWQSQNVTTKSGNSAWGNTWEAFEYYKKAADLGARGAMFKLGEYYEKGIPIRGSKVSMPPNFNLAFEWYLKSAKNGYPKGLLALGEILGGNVVNNKKVHFNKINLKQAYSWFIKAYENGENEALYFLAFMNRNGSGTKEDLNKSKILYELFLEKCSKDKRNLISYELESYAAHNIAYLYYDLNEYDKMYLWSKKLSEKYIMLSHHGEYLLANCYYYGYGVDKDLDVAMEYLRRAAKNGQEKAINDLKIMEESN